MLVLTRNIGESIIVGDYDIVIGILGIRKGGQVRIGIQADPNISIHRKEIKEKIDREAIGIANKNINKGGVVENIEGGVIEGYGNR